MTADPHRATRQFERAMMTARANAQRPAPPTLAEKIEFRIRELEAYASPFTAEMEGWRMEIEFLREVLGELATSERDTKRLDWWTAHPDAVQSCLYNTDPTAALGSVPLAPFRVVWGWRLPAPQSPTFNDVRVAVDAAMSVAVADAERDTTTEHLPPELCEAIEKLDGVRS